MSHSFKKHAITGTTTAKSEKFDKRILNRRLRRIAERKLRESPEEFIEPKKDEVMNAWDMAKDGKIDWTGTDFEKKARRK